MIFPDTWPYPVRQFLNDSFGKPLSIHELNGVVYEIGCFRVEFANQSVIVKQTRQPREWFLYKEKSSFLKNAGVALPSLYYANKEEGAHWLVLENVPLPLPKNRWEADSGVLKILFSLHFNTRKKELPLKSPFMPFWSNEMSTKALACFPKEIALEIKPWLEVVKERSWQIFQPLCWISGDPNPTNWGIRSTGNRKACSF